MELSASLQSHLKVGGPTIPPFTSATIAAQSATTRQSSAAAEFTGPLPGAMALHESVLTVKIACVVQQLPDVQRVDLQGANNPFSALLGPRTLLETHK